MNNGSGRTTEPREELIASLKAEGLLRSRSIEDSLRRVDREGFVWNGDPIALAYLDEPAPLGNTGQTISAPHMIIIMLEELELSPGMKVLEVGTGSGYSASLIGCVVSKGLSCTKEPLVVTIETNDLLARTGRKNIDKAGLSRIVKVVQGDGSLGYPQRSIAPTYDRIMVTAAAPRVPHLLIKQLKSPGILVIPIGGLGYQKLMKIDKTKNGDFHMKEVTACTFVPLVGEDSFTP